VIGKVICDTCGAEVYGVETLVQVQVVKGKRCGFGSVELPRQKLSPCGHTGSSTMTRSTPSFAQRCLEIGVPPEV